MHSVTPGRTVSTPASQRLIENHRAELWSRRSFPPSGDKATRLSDAVDLALGNRVASAEVDRT